MTTPAVGLEIGLSSVNTELNIASSALISLNDTAVRTLAGRTTPGSEIGMSDLRGKSNRVIGSVTTPSNTTLYNVQIKPSNISGYIAGKTDYTYTISSTTKIASNSTSVAALTVSGFVAGDTITIINNGKIIGKGGAGGKGGGILSGYVSVNATNGGAGGPGLSISNNIKLTNNGTILGGGGGGGGGGFVALWMGSYYSFGGGNGGGGGAGIDGGSGGAGGDNTIGGTGGVVGNAGSETSGGTSPATFTQVAWSNGSNPSGYTGGTGGAPGAAGGNGTTANTWSPTPVAGSGGAAGTAIVTNGYSTS